MWMDLKIAQSAVWRNSKHKFCLVTRKLMDILTCRQDQFKFVKHR